MEKGRQPRISRTLGDRGVEMLRRTVGQRELGSEGRPRAVRGQWVGGDLPRGQVSCL